MRISLFDGQGNFSTAAVALFVGGGDGLELSAALASGVNRVVVLEPDPDIVAELRAGEAAVTVIPAALAEAPGQAVLHRYDFSILSGIAAPAPAMQTVFPGLSQLDQVEVDCITLVMLLDSLGLKPRQATVLVVNAPAFASQAVSALLKLPVAMRFRDVVFRAPIEPLYEGTSALDDLMVGLRAAGYDEVARDQDDVLLPFVHFHLDHTALALSDCEAQNERLQAALAKMRDTVRMNRRQALASRREAEMLSVALAEKTAEAAELVLCYNEATEAAKVAVSELIDAKNAFGEEAKVRDASLIAMRKELNVRKEQVGQLSQDITKVRTQLQNELSKTVAAKAERDALSEKLVGLTSEQESLRSKLNAQLDAAQEAEKMRKERIEAMQQHETAQEAKLDELALHGAEEMVVDLRKQVADLKAELADANNTLNKQKAVSSADAQPDDGSEADQLKRLLKREREINSALREEFQRMKDQVSLFNSVIAASRSLE